MGKSGKHFKGKDRIDRGFENKKAITELWQIKRLKYIENSKELSNKLLAILKDNRKNLKLTEYNILLNCFYMIPSESELEWDDFMATINRSDFWDIVTDSQEKEIKKEIKNLRLLGSEILDLGCLR